ncbi:MAG: flagellar M-ring protein FliF [Nitrospirae bacterium]|nr:MAG: flagellar M-ring protein FliF [Nitrospirota bacterium]
MGEQTDRLTALLENVQKNFQRLSMAQRIGLFTLLAFAIAAIPVLFFLGQEPEMSVLFSNLEEGDVQAIVTRLEAQQIPYAIAGGGNTILVPQERVHRLRIQMASEGLPETSGVGFEIFDRTNLGIGEFAQKVNYRRALQGELARTISQMPGVQRARVHVVIPERRLFSSEREPARAAVVISPKRGVTLQPSQVEGIVHLVASSVEGLDPKNVTVVDHHGQVLTRPEQEGQVELTGSQLEIQRALETDLERRVQTMLDHVLGPNKSIVRVSATMNFRQVEVTKEVFDPEGQVVRSEQRSQEKVMGEESPGGVPGARSNVPNEEPPAAGTNTKEAKRKTETINYEVNRTVSKIVEPSGTIGRLSVSVLVDGLYQTTVDKDTGETVRQYVPRSEEELAKLRESVKTAVGFSAERGDQIEVVNYQFEATPPEVAEADTMGTLQELVTMWGGYLKPVVFFLLGVLIVVFVIRPLVKTVVEPPPSPAALTAQGLPATVAELEAEKKEEESPEQQAVQLAIQNPQAAAFVIREWMREENETAET